MLTNLGSLTAQNGGLIFVAGNATNNGTVVTDGGEIIFDGSVTGAGKMFIRDDGALEFSGATASNVVFDANSDGLLTLGNADLFKGKITGFNEGDYIDLLDVGFANASIVSYKSNVLTITDGVDVAKVRFLGAYSLGNFSIEDNGFGSTRIDYDLL